MTTRIFERAIVCAGFVALSMWLVGQTALAKTKVVDCDKGKSIQTEVDKVTPGDPATIFITGVCNEDVNRRTGDGEGFVAARNVEEGCTRNMTLSVASLLSQIDELRRQHSCDVE